MDFEFGNVPSRAHELFHKLETQGVTYVEGLVEAQKCEELFLDYKRISTPPDAKALNDADRANLRKALSGFSNSEGGVILWGLETAKNNGVEVPRRPEGSDNPARFASLIEDAVSGCTVPPVPGVRSIVIPTNSDATKGLVATLIPSSLIAPHQTTDDGRAYFMRAGSSFQRVPHGVLAGMFGRRPSPVISMHWKVTECSYAQNHKDAGRARVTFEMELENLSGVVANDAYISWSAKELGTDYSDLRVKPFNAVKWHVNRSNQRNGSSLASSDHRLAPYSKYTVLSLELDFYGEITEGVDIFLIFGCTGCQPQCIRMKVGKDELIQIVQEIGALEKSVAGFDPRKSHTRREASLEIGRRILGSPSSM